ncbi:MAG TPA: N,N-dimethylformamidase beta subunit family domain-containing protein [Actinocrinis sp.]|nr:N,N-dimethylformamidase beta subunit family domain-containing protein [Actinocrinis sp.]
MPPHYRTEGCGWSFENPTNSANWTLKSTGLYAFRLHGPNGMHYDIPFVVTPGANDTKAPFAVLLPYNTYNAWGGHDKYNQPTADRWTSSFMRPSNVVNIDPNGHISHTLFNDLFLLSWMDQKGIQYDCYIDADLDSGNLDHTKNFLLDNTTLDVGSTFGATAYNTAANGWECDNAVQSESATFTKVATGTAGGGDLTFRTLPGNGWIFTAGSINFNSALPYDANISQILYNAFNYTPPSA